MPNKVEVTFDSKDTGVVKTIEEITNKLPEIARSAQAVTSQTDILEAKLRNLTATAQVYKKEITGAELAALRAQGIEAIDKARQAIEKEADAQRRLNAEKKETLKIDQQVDAAVARIRAQRERTATIARESSPTTRRLQFAAPEVAASTALERTTTGFNKAAEGAKKLQSGAAELRQTLFSLSGVPFPEAANQLSKLANLSFSGALAIASIAAIGAAAAEASQKVREQAEADLKRIQAAANLGLTGGLESRNEQLDKLQKALQASREAQAIGQNPNIGIRNALATEVKENDIKKAAREAAQTFTAVFDENLAQGLFGDPKKLFVGIENQRDLENQINAILQQRQKIEDALGISQANRLKLAREQHKAEEEVLDTATQIFSQLVREHEEAEQARVKARQGAEQVIKQLEKQLQTNPIARVFDEAADRADNLRRQFPDLAEDLAGQFEAVNERVKNLDIFRGAIGTAGNLNRLLQQRAEVAEGGGIFVEHAQREAREQQLQQAQELLKLSSNAAQRKLALDNILAATSDVRSLTPDQRDIRRGALDEEIKIERQLLKEQFEHLRDQSEVTRENTAALGEVSTLLSALQNALINFAGEPIKIEVKTEDSSAVNLGSVTAQN